MTPWDQISAINEFRQLMMDGAADKRASQKNLIGIVNGTNTSFRTYDKHLVPDTLEVFQAGVDITDNVTIDDPLAGELTIDPAPGAGSSSANISLKASYYWQWWTDDKVIEYLNKGAEKLGFVTPINPPVTGQPAVDVSYQSVIQGLRTACLYHAATHAQNGLIQYMMNRKHSGEYLAEQDGNDDSGFAQIMKSMQDSLKFYQAAATTYGDNYYKRDGRRNAPAFGIKIARTRRWGPIR